MFNGTVVAGAAFRPPLPHFSCTPPPHPSPETRTANQAPRMTSTPPPETVRYRFRLAGVAFASHKPPESIKRDTRILSPDHSPLSPTPARPLHQLLHQLLQHCRPQVPQGPLPKLPTRKVNRHSRRLATARGHPTGCQRSGKNRASRLYRLSPPARPPRRSLSRPATSSSSIGASASLLSFTLYGCPPLPPAPLTSASLSTSSTVSTRLHATGGSPLCRNSSPYSLGGDTCHMHTVALDAS